MFYALGVVWSPVKTIRAEEKTNKTESTHEYLVKKIRVEYWTTGYTASQDWEHTESYVGTPICD